MRDRCKRLMRTAASFIVAWAALLNSTGAQEGIPASSFVPPDAVECPADARLTTERLRDLGATAATGMPEGPAAPVGDVTPTRVPAAAETATAVTTTIRHYFACLNDGDWAAAFGLHAGDTLRFLVTDPTHSFMDVDPTTATYPFLKTRSAWEGIDRGRLDVYHVTMRPDGRVGAAIGIESTPRRAEQGFEYLVLAWEHDRWRLVSPIPTLAFPFGEIPTAIPWQAVEMKP